MNRRMRSSTVGSAPRGQIFARARHAIHGAPKVAHLENDRMTEVTPRSSIGYIADHLIGGWRGGTLRPAKKAGGLPRKKESSNV